MILALLLQITYHPPPDSATAFRNWVRSAAYNLRIVQPVVEVTTTNRWAASVPHGPGAQWKIMVRPDFLAASDPKALRSVAYHETCHLYLGNNRRDYFPGEESLAHLMIAGCVEWLHGTEFHIAMTTMPCQKWYPYEATRYNRLIGKERCR